MQRQRRRRRHGRRAGKRKNLSRKALAKRRKAKAAPRRVTDVVYPAAATGFWFCVDHYLSHRGTTATTERRTIDL